MNEHYEDLLSQASGTDTLDDVLQTMLARIQVRTAAASADSLAGGRDWIEILIGAHIGQVMGMVVIVDILLEAYKF